MNTEQLYFRILFCFALYSTAHCSQKSLDESLIAAVKSNDLASMRKMINYGANLNAEDSRFFSTPLQWAAYNNYPEIAKKLIWSGANLDSQNTDKNPNNKAAIIWATRHPDGIILEMLINAGANINIQDKYGRTALMDSVFIDNFDNFRTLVWAYANPNIKTYESKENVYDFVKNKPKMKMILDEFDKVRAERMKALERELFGAVTEIYAEQMLRKLLHKGVNVNAKNGDMTPLMRAARHGNKEVVKILIQAGAQPNIQDDRGHTALTYAAEGYSSSGPEIINELVEAGANPNMQNKLGRTPLMVGVSRKTQELSYRNIDALIKNGTDLNIQDIYGFTALMIAALTGEKEFIIQLLNANANPCEMSYDEQTIRKHLKNLQEAGMKFGEETVSNLIDELAGKTFESILQKEHPDFLQNTKIQTALALCKDRQEKQKKILSEHVLPELAGIIAEYAGIPSS